MTVVDREPFTCLKKQGDLRLLCQGKGCNNKEVRDDDSHPSKSGSVIRGHSLRSGNLKFYEIFIERTF